MAKITSKQNKQNYQKWENTPQRSTEENIAKQTSERMNEQTTNKQVNQKGKRQ